MKILKIAGVVLAAAVLAIQFVRPGKNQSVPNPANSITQHFATPDSVATILRRSCYDCHSDNTVYPWYAEVEPVGWWLNGHIENGKRHVNYDEYGTYRPLRQFIRFRDLIQQVKRDEMPLPSYVLIHRYAILSPREKELLIDWSTAMMDSMKATYPPDSLRFRPRGGNGERPPTVQGTRDGKRD